MSDVLQKTAETYTPKGRLNPDAFEHTINFSTHTPPDDLKPFVDHFWIIRWKDISKPYFSQEVMHKPYVDLFISANESGIQGTFRGKRTYEAVGDGRIIGTRFRPGAFHTVWSGMMSELQDRNMSLEHAFPHINPDTIQTLLSQDDKSAVIQLADLIRTVHPTPDSAIDFINKIIDTVENDPDLTTVTEVAKKFGRSERALQQFFSDYLGIGLKWLLKRRKLIAAAEEIRETKHPNWATLAYNLGYSSQQHFITDLKQVTGQTPVQYKKSTR